MSGRRVRITSDDLLSSENGSSGEDVEVGRDAGDYAPRRPKYPSQHSFVVDMNNRPLYECDRKPIKTSPVKVSPRAPPPQTRVDSMAHLPPTPRSSVPYYPSKSPYAPVNQRRYHWPAWLQASLVIGAVLISLILLIVVLCELVFTRQELGQVREQVEEIGQALGDRYNGINVKRYSTFQG
eukprot:snap_masked-scaffold57_size444674-processed-gene-0.12 protein:Tk04359 transcript:snap_masked-scaffold57_size444674-processed-gene-0.12-mRNA-1 annotation:"hypothetical protein PCH70_36320"